MSARRPDHGGREFGLEGLDPVAQANLSANLVTVMQAGAFAGALLANPLADKFGRKPGLLTVSIFAFIGGFLQAFAYGHLSCFYIGRYVTLGLPLRKELEEGGVRK